MTARPAPAGLILADPPFGASVAVGPAGLTPPVFANTFSPGRELTGSTVPTLGQIWPRGSRA